MLCYPGGVLGNHWGGCTTWLLYATMIFPHRPLSLNRWTRSLPSPAKGTKDNKQLRVITAIGGGDDHDDDDEDDAIC
jgi:hypothetical protein